MMKNNSSGARPIIYNVTIKVALTIADQWLSWLLDEHIPEVMSTSCFTKYSVLKLLNTDDEQGITYAVQYNADSMEDYNHYLNNYANDLRKKSFEKWGDHFIAFRTLMEVVH
ncbi:MAG TPA: DUF4286 family protein [Chitinophagaceae bacterium]|nr:DUF4286 family protein [Chitinophagaceae bacterium]